MEFAYKIYENENDLMLAIADFEILGKTFSSGDKNIEVKEEFYFKEKCDETKIKEFFDRCTIINAVGKNCIEILIKENIISKENIIEIEGVPHAQYIKI